MALSHDNKDQSSQVTAETFSIAITSLIHPSNKEGSKLISYLDRTANLMQIKNFNVEEVINEAFLRGLIALEAGKLIKNPKSWFSKVCHNILCDMQTGEKKNRLLKKKNREILETDDSLSSVISSEQGKFASIAYSQLSAQDKQIINLRVNHGLSYREIKSLYESDLGQEVSEAALRKRDSRAVARLRENFWACYE